MQSIAKEDSDAIIGFEISGPEYYKKVEQFPTYPGGASGITIGIGYDLGYHTLQELSEDFGPHLPPSVIVALSKVVGLKGDGARIVLSTVRSLVIPLDAAMDVFDNIDIPRTMKQLVDGFPNVDQLTQPCLGSMLSLVFNRGTSIADSNDDTEHRRREMLGIWNCMKAMDLKPIPQLMRDMERLWPTLPGLVVRREWEAKRFQEGLGAVVDSPTDVSLPAQAVAVQDGVLSTDELNDAEAMKLRIATDEEREQNAGGQNA